MLNILLTAGLYAQNCKVCGEYLLKGVMETASGFKLNPDSTFEFFFSSGALDRYGSGKWMVFRSTDDKVDIIRFNSSPPPGPAIKTITTEKRKQKQLLLQLKDVNPVLKSYFIALAFAGKDTVVEPFNQDGIAGLDGKIYDSLQVALEFCPDNLIVLQTSTGNNYFELSAEEWIFEYFFKNFVLIVREEELEGKHPLMEGGFIYKKQE